MNRDREHLKLLSIFNYIYGGLCLSFLLPSLFIFFPYIPDIFNYDILSLILLSLSILSMGINCIGPIASRRFLIKRKRYWFSFAFACVQCLIFPLLTVLGVFTIIVLSRDSVKTLYGLENV